MSNTQSDPRQKPVDVAALHKRAEEQAGTMEPISLSEHSPEAIQQMIHKLRVRQIELAMQNEDLRRAQAETEAERRRYFDLYELAPLGYASVNEEGLILEANLTFATLLGVNRCSLVKQVLTRFILKEDQDIYDLHRKKIFECDEPQECELRLVKPDGACFWAHLAGTADQAEDGMPACQIVMGDITERKRAEDALLFQRSQLISIFDSIGEPIYVTDPKTYEILYVNQFLKSMYSKDIVGKICYQEFQGKDTPCDFCTNHVIMGTNDSVYQWEHYNRELDKYYFVTDRLIKWPDGRDVRFELAIDITKRKRAEDALRESEEHLLATLRSIGDGVIACDDEGNVESLNRSAEVLTGWTTAESAGRPIQDVFRIINAQTREKAGNPVFQALSEGVNVDLANHTALIARDGTEYQIADSCAPIRNSSGVVVGAVLVFRDVTEEYRRRQELREYRERLEHILSITRTGIDIVDVDCNLLFVDKGWQKLHGDPSGRKCYEYFNGLSDPCPGCYIPKALETKEVVVTEKVLLRENNRIVEVHTIPFQDAAGQWLVAGFNVDITERKRAEEALRKSEERFKSIIAVSNTGAWEYHRNRDYLWCSPEYFIMLGRDPNKFIMDGRSNLKEAWIDLIHPDDRQAATERFAEYQRRGAVGMYENSFRLQRSNGESVWIWSRGQTLRNPDGSLSEVTVGTHIDITDRKKFEAQLAQVQKMESIGRLAGGIAHDFNNMLQTIMGYTEMALEQVDRAKPLFADLQEVRKVSLRTADLTRQLLTFARKQTIAPRVIYLNENVEGMLKMLRRLLGENIDLLWKPGTNLCQVHVDPSQIDQILVNLCLNARDAIAGVGRITIETGAATLDEASCADHPELVPGDYVILAVSDNGCGMDKETLAQVFEPFFTTKDVGEGTGLGLPSVYGAVKQNNGFIHIYSEPGQGTTCKIYLPRHQANTPVRAVVATPQPASCGSETILLVEDEPAILRMISMQLQRLGYSVIAAKNPGEAIRLAHEHSGPIHLLLTDVIMPEMNGRDLAEKLLSFHPQLRRIFMSGYSAQVIANHGMLDEGVHFIQKPFSLKDLGVKLRKVIEG